MILAYSRCLTKVLYNFFKGIKLIQIKEDILFFDTKYPDNAKKTLHIQGDS